MDADSVRNCGICCGGFSLFAIVFLLSISGLFASGSELLEVPHGTDRQAAAATCRYGALIYFVTFLMSLGCFWGPLFIKRGAEMNTGGVSSPHPGTSRRRITEPDQL